jgi:hypothetical protein
MTLAQKFRVEECTNCKFWIGRYKICSDMGIN